MTGELVLILAILAGFYFIGRAVAGAIKFLMERGMGEGEEAPVGSFSSPLKKRRQKVKHLKACAVVGSALLISLALLALPASPGTYFVLASPGDGGNYGESGISEVRIYYMVDATPKYVDFGNTGETQYVEGGAVLSWIEAIVRIENVYAPTAADAVANTRVHVLVKDPSENTIYDSVLPSIGPVAKSDNCWYVMYATHPLEEALITGKYTITTTYEIFVEPA